MEEEVKNLMEQTARTRHQFLEAEIQTCLTALGVAQYELSIGNTGVVQSEIGFVEKGIRVIRRFLLDVALEQRTELDNRLAMVEEKLAGLKADLNRSSPPAAPRVR